MMTTALAEAAAPDPSAPPPPLSSPYMSTPALRGRPHNPLDWSVVGLDSEEDLHTDDSPFLKALERDMERECIVTLAKRYPELVFTRTAGAKKPKGCDFVERNAGAWVGACWRTAA